ncbi:hypothetical protein DPEC_G00184160 [Dallia pectoralis]|uniref:Uncharacterized protein n=1 Tax=Dallia pectoralis TaxID=75939 RepID=A0ACC2GAU2_DALPE|nr:hypothetical protein DPEC_G00184160 [Dallia pectoralis]
MSSARVLHERISTVMDLLASSAVTEVCKLVDECCGALRVEVFQSKKQIKMLEEKLSLAESKHWPTSDQRQTSVTGLWDASATTTAGADGDADGVDVMNDGRTLKLESVTCNQPSLWRAVSTAPPGKAVSLTLTPFPPAFAPYPTAGGSEMPGPIVRSCDIPRKRHITCFQVGETPKIQQCTTCCSLYHCPFCQPSAFKPNEFHRVIPHIQSHLRGAVQNDEYVVYNCKLPCRDNPHYHCSYCDHVVRRKDLFVRHFEACRKQNRTARVEAQTSVAAVQFLEQRSPAQSAVAPTSSAPVVSTNSSGVPQTTSPGTEDPNTSANHNPVAHSSSLDSEPSSPEVYSCPMTLQVDAERTKNQRPVQKDSGPVQTQCNHCGILLNRKNFRVHLKRKHHDEYVAQENEDALRRYLANTREDVPPWRRQTRVQCEHCGIRLNKKNFWKHMKRKHHVLVKPSDCRESLDRCLGEQGLLVVESALLCSARTEAEVTGGREGCDEGCTTDLFLDIDMGEEQGLGFPDTSAQLSLKSDLAFQPFKDETVQIGPNPHRYHGLGKPHLLELPLESLVWIFRDVLSADGKKAYWTLSLVCRTFRTILKNEIIRRYSKEQRSEPESQQ